MQNTLRYVENSCRDCCSVNPGCNSIIEKSPGTTFIMETSWIFYINIYKIIGNFFHKNNSMRIIKHSSSCCQIINYVNIIWPLGVSAFNISGIWLESGIYSETLSLITNTSKEFIKCRVLHFLIMEYCKYIVF